MGWKTYLRYCKLGHSFLWQHAQTPYGGRHYLGQDVESVRKELHKSVSHCSYLGLQLCKFSCIEAWTITVKANRKRNGIFLPQSHFVVFGSSWSSGFRSSRGGVAFSCCSQHLSSNGFFTKLFAASKMVQKFLSLLYSLPTNLFKNISGTGTITFPAKSNGIQVNYCSVVRIKWSMTIFVKF